MLENLKLKTILPLTVACLMVASGAYAGNSVDQDQPLELAGSISRRKASDLELKSQSSKRQKLPEVFFDFQELPKNIWEHISKYLSASDLLNLRLSDKRIDSILPELWKQKVSHANPHVNFSQAWVEGPVPGSFHNFVLNLAIHRIQLEFGASLPVVSVYRSPQEVTTNYNMTHLRAIKDCYGALTTIFDCFHSVLLRLHKGEPIGTFLSENRVSRLKNSGDAEKRLVQFFHFLNGEPFDKNSPLYVAPKPGEPKPIVELISDELALRERIRQTSDADRLPLYEELLANGVYLTTKDFRNAAHANFHAKQYEQEARYYEAVLTRLGADATADDFRSAGLAWLRAHKFDKAAAHYEDVFGRVDAYATAHFEAVFGSVDAWASTQDFRCAAYANFYAKQYEQAARYYEAVLRRLGTDATTDDFRNAGLACVRAQKFDKAAAHREAVLGRPDATTQDFRNAAESCFNAQQYEQAAAHREAVLRRPDATTDDFRNAAQAHFHAKQYEQAARYYEDVLTRLGMDATTQDFRNAGLAWLRAQKFDKAAAHREAVLTRPDATIQDFRDAAHAHYYAKQYEQAAAHREAVLARLGADATIGDFTAAAFACLLGKKYEQSARHYESVLKRPDATTQDFRCAAESCFNAKQYEQAANYYEILLTRPDCTDQDRNLLEQLRLIIQAEKKE